MFIYYYKLIGTCSVVKVIQIRPLNNKWFTCTVYVMLFDTRIILTSYIDSSFVHHLSTERNHENVNLATPLSVLVT